MENLNLIFEDEILHSIPRKDIGIELDFSLLSFRLVDDASQQNWLIAVLADADNIPINLYFKEKYMVECAYLLWEYFLKQKIKKIS